jgi:hypothetical protein
MDDLNNFLAVSNLAKKIKVKPRVILQRNRHWRPVWKNMICVN